MRKKVKPDLLLTFFNEYLAKVTLLHNYTLVITLLVEGYEVRKILIDTEGASNDIFPYTIKKMDIALGRIVPHKNHHGWVH